MSTNLRIVVNFIILVLRGHILVHNYLMEYSKYKIDIDLERILANTSSISV